MKPTPGPWEAKRNLANYRRWRIQSSDVNKSAIAETAFWLNSDSPEEEEANAFLLAAAPALLKALEDIFAMLDEGLLVRDISTDNESGWSLKALGIVKRLKTAQQAITKAQKGE